MNSNKLMLIFSVPSILLYAIIDISLHVLIITNYGLKFDIPLLVTEFIGTNKTIDYLLALHVISLSFGYIDVYATLSISTLLLFMLKLSLSNIIDNLLKNISLDEFFKILNDLIKKLEQELNIEFPILNSNCVNNNFDVNNKQQDKNNEKVLNDKEEEHKKQVLSDYYDRLEKTPKRFTFHNNDDDLSNDSDILKNNYDKMIEKCLPTHKSNSDLDLDTNETKSNNNEQFINGERNENLKYDDNVESIKQNTKNESKSNEKENKYFTNTDEIIVEEPPEQEYDLDSDSLSLFKSKNINNNPNTMTFGSYLSNKKNNEYYDTPFDNDKLYNKSRKNRNDKNISKRESNWRNEINLEKDKGNSTTPPLLNKIENLNQNEEENSKNFNDKI